MRNETQHLYVLRVTSPAGEDKGLKVPGLEPASVTRRAATPRTSNARPPYRHPSLDYNYAPWTYDEYGLVALNPRRSFRLVLDVHHRFVLRQRFLSFSRSLHRHHRRM